MTLLPHSLVRRIFPCLLAAALAGCTAAPIGTGINDPAEAQNRKVHLTNRALDRSIVRPVSRGYGTVVPGPVRTGLSNFTSNLGMPGEVLNNLLQFRIEDAGHNTFRFLMNTTFGLAGLLDVATEAGLENRATDFGETLHVWGVREGAYLELPLLGPSTGRAAVGRVVDLALNPLNFAGIDSSARQTAVGLGVAARFGDRYRYSDLVDSVLYESADSYAQARLLYLQNRRFKLSNGAVPDYLDPYEDPYEQQ